MGEDTKKILDSCGVGGLATVDYDGEPNLSPLHFVRVDDEIYFLTDKNSDHTNNIANSKKVEFVVWDEKKHGVYIKSDILRVDGSEKVEKMYDRKFQGFRPKLENPIWLKMKIGQLDEHKTTKIWRHFIA